MILTTPPGFRPIHFEAAVKQNKHIFMEKPVATDPAGIKKCWMLQRSLSKKIECGSRPAKKISKLISRTLQEKRPYWRYYFSPGLVE
ncbi:Gfo/Idh/MocA family oxidoreductase [Niabella sp. W65]|nr:Gfo/Idh/MocA family oxidoreductase [Niabella sp. W65]MCH7361894.1 Gfo/Idh/MocA family oxidoreductase [Niabella sp. W65]ULT45651.1 Gfo/Idh/MocA family oxidoreductase [Niabella sp. I65]